MRRTVAILGALVLGVVAYPPTVASAAPQPDGLSAADRASLAAGLPLAPKAAPGKAPAGPNPYLALLPDPSKADFAGWSNWLAANAPQKAGQRASVRSLSAAATSTPVVADENEPAGTRGANENTGTAEQVTGFGTAAGQNAKLRIIGALSPETATPASVPANSEDDGSIPLAGVTGVGSSRSGITTSGVIGDGPNGGTGSGDFDFYRVDAVAGQFITADVDTPTGSLDSIVAIYDATGKLVGSNDDNGAETDSLLKYVAPAAGAYYVMVAGYGNVPANPLESTSGDGSGSQGAYTVTITATRDDLDFYAVKLRKGDVLGASVAGSARRIAIYDPASREVHGSDQDATYLYPAVSPLPGGGNAVVDYVAQANGWHYVGISGGAGGYNATVELYRAPLEDHKPVQTVFLDFDGARVNTAIFGGPGVRELSPLSAFLANWGLTTADQDALVDRIVDRVDENIINDVDASGVNARFEMKLTNSRDHADTFGKANVSRLIVGGTVAQSGVNAISVAQSIDPGNFATAETALVQLDILSDTTGAGSLNTYLTPATSKADRINFIGDALGNVISHEAGHLFGNWDTDPFNGQANLMDQGGNFPQLFGVGPDGVGGTADDADVDFGDDAFNPTEGFTGTENTLARVAFGATT